MWPEVGTHSLVFWSLPRCWVGFSSLEERPFRMVLCSHVGALLSRDSEPYAQTQAGVEPLARQR